jgi:hypothetical protein
METCDGWYARLVTPDGATRTQWVTVQNFWLCTFNQRRDPSPALGFHLSLAEIADALAETGQLHSIKFVPGHPCNYRSLCIYTPNQFDIAAIKQAIGAEQERWRALVASAEPELPQSFIVDLSGKFVFRPSDRLKITVKPSTIIVQQLNQMELALTIDRQLEVHPTLEPDQEVNWIQIHFWADSIAQSLRLHCSTVGDMMKLVTLLLHCKGRLLNAH